MKHSISCFIIMLSSVCHYSLAQEIWLQGSIVDDKTGRGLPFAHIIVNEGEWGASTDLDGKFSLKVRGEIKKVVFTYIGYETFVYTVQHPDDLKPLSRPLSIRLRESMRTLAEIQVRAGDNPAHRLIKAAVARRKSNSPYRQPFFQYRSHHKFWLTLEDTPIDTSAYQKLDSIEREGVDIAAVQHFMMIETLSERKFRAPASDYETIIANRVSGLENPFMLALSSRIQQINFYEDYITFLDKKYLNPLSPGSWEKYFFAMEDTILSAPDTIYVISFQPLPKKNFSGLTGKLHIHTAKFALQNIEITTPEEDAEFLQLVVKQHTERVEELWFPAQTQTEIYFNKQRLGGKRMLGVARTLYRDVRLDIIPKAGIPESGISHPTEANKRDEIFWQQNRIEALNSKELKTYQVVDSLGKAEKLQGVFNVVDYLTRGRVPLSPKIDLDIWRVLNFNRFEGLRLEGRFLTSEGFSRRVTLGAYLAYGTKDGRFKYGALAYYLLPYLPLRYQAQIGIEYANDVAEPGRIQFAELARNQGVRNVLAERMGLIEQWRLVGKIRPISNLQAELIWKTEKNLPRYAYTYTSSAAEQIPAQSRDAFWLSEMGVRLHYTHRTEFMSIGTRRIQMSQKPPILSLNYWRGNTTLGGEYTYHRWEARAEYAHTFRHLGISTIQLMGGMVRGEAPYPVLYNGMGMTGRIPVAQAGYFQTMQLYEFLSDRMVQLFFMHDFGTLLYKSPLKWSRPELALLHGMAWGSLRYPNAHQGIDFKTMERGYMESGLMLNSLLRTNYADTLYWNFGVGVYMRYGYYAQPHFSDNLAFRLLSKFSF